jgi:hypothetical protein
MSKKSKYIANLNGLAINYAIKPRAGKRESDRKRYVEQKVKQLPERQQELAKLLSELAAMGEVAIKIGKIGKFIIIRNRLKKLIAILKGAE